MHNQQCHSFVPGNASAAVSVKLVDLLYSQHVSLLYKTEGAVAAQIESWVCLCCRGALTYLRTADQPVHAI